MNSDSTTLSTRAAGTPVPMDEVAGRIQEISTLPSVALRVMEIAGDPSAGAGDLKAAVEADPALCVRMLRCVNSAAFSLRREVSDVGQAIAFLGFNRIRDLAVTATVSELFRSSEPVASYDRGALWRHLAATGIGARMIAVRTRLPGFEDAFLAGLLHDLGIILLDQHCHDAFRQIILSLTSQTTLCEVERKFLGWDHTELGEKIAEQWRLPKTAMTSIRHHHTPERVTGPDAPIAHSVALANLLVTLKGHSSVGMNLIGLPPGTLEVLRLSREDVKVIAEDLDRELELNRQLFEIQKG